MNTTGRVRVTVAAEGRRIELALPESSPLAEILPDLLRDAGEQLAERGKITGGWMLRRTDGSVLEPDRTLAAHRVTDGEVLNLMPTRIDWPEPEYDEPAEAGAAEPAPASGAWEPRHTRWAGLAVGTAAILLSLLAILRSGPPWWGPGLWALGLAALALTVAVVLTRALRDAGAGAVYTAAALACAFTGGGLLFAGDHALSALGTPHLLAAGAALLLVAVVGLLGLAGRSALLVAAGTIGLLTVFGAWLNTTGALEVYEAAAIVAGVGLAFSPLLAPLSIQLARVPLPVLPRGTADLLQDDPRPPRSAVYATVVRADGLLTGMIAGIAGVTVPCQVLLVRSGDTAGLILVAVLTAGFVLRARLHRTVAQRVALLVAGGSGAVCLAADPLLADRPGLLSVAGPILVALAAIAVLAGLRHSIRNPSPPSGSHVDLLEVVTLLTVVPAVCAVLGLYG